MFIKDKTSNIFHLNAFDETVWAKGIQQNSSVTYTVHVCTCDNDISKYVTSRVQVRRWMQDSMGEEAQMPNGRNAE